MKTCNVCNQAKELTQFCKDKSKKDGLSGTCRNCVAVRCKLWYAKEQNATTVRIRSEQYYAQHKEEVKLYARNRQPLKKQYMKKWREKNKESILRYKRKYETLKKRTDVGYRMLCNLRNRINIALKTNAKSTSTKELLGCSITDLRKHLESKFVDGMTWGNYGIKGWHIDHIVPCASFDLSKSAEQQKCFHFTNLQPLWHEDNIRKSDNLPAHS